MSGEPRSTRMARRCWALIALCVALMSCGGSAFEYQVPRATGDGWTTASLADVGLDTESLIDLVEFVDADKAWAMHGIVVVKDDKLVFEQYFDGHRFD